MFAQSGGPHRSARGIARPNAIRHTHTRGRIRPEQRRDPSTRAPARAPVVKAGAGRSEWPRSRACRAERLWPAPTRPVPTNAHGTSAPRPRAIRVRTRLPTETVAVSLPTWTPRPRGSAPRRHSAASLHCWRRIPRWMGGFRVRPSRHRRRPHIRHSATHARRGRSTPCRSPHPSFAPRDRRCIRGSRHAKRRLQTA